MHQYIKPFMVFLPDITGAEDRHRQYCQYHYPAYVCQQQSRLVAREGQEGQSDNAEEFGDSSQSHDQCRPMVFFLVNKVIGEQ